MVYRLSHRLLADLLESGFTGYLSLSIHYLGLLVNGLPG
jgi:hypothetical protein